MTDVGEFAIRFAMEPRHVQMVLDILEKHVPEQDVWVFGSRATGKHLKRFSDLDLAVDGQLDDWRASALREDFEESLLPIKVDVIALGNVDPEFSQRIGRDFQPIQRARRLT